MKHYLLFGTALTFGIAGCADMKLQRVPPGQSIARHLQGPRELATETLPPPAAVDLPTAAGPGGPTMDAGQANPQFAGRPQIIGATPAEQLPPLPISGLPERNDGIERAGEAYNRGSLLMKGGQNREAIAAFEEATQLDPAFADAWTRLTLLYEKVGQPDKAREAFRRAKGLSPQPERITTPAPAEPLAPPPIDDAPLPPPKN